MGAVYLGHDVELKRQVAIKVIREEIHELETLDRFFHEARASAALRHPNIITIYAIGQHEHQPYMVMEFIDGESLADIIRNRSDVPILNKLSYLEQICSGLHFAHRAGIIHRDVKPANVMVDTNGMARILDFGIARVEGTAMTQGGALIGSVNYMSPEQMLGKPIDHRSDIFSVGLLAYELLSYQQAFKGGLNDGILQRLPYEHPPSLSDICGDLPVGLEAVIVRALQKAPDDRFQDLAEMRAAIVDIQRRVESPATENTMMILREALQAAFNTAETAPPPSMFSDVAAGPDVTHPDRAFDLPPVEPPPPPAPPEPAPATWDVRRKPSHITPRRVIPTMNPPSSGTSRPSTSTKSSTTGFRRRDTAVPPQPPPSSPKRIVLVAGAAILVVAVAVTVSWLAFAASDRLEHERLGVAAAMERFRVAYRNRDLDAVRAAFPALPGDAEQAMKRMFTSCLVYEVTFDQLALVLMSAEAATAQAEVWSTHTCTPQSTGRQTTAAHHDVYTLGKRGDRWQIESIDVPSPTAAARQRKAS
jgi:serine/threonine protein kinase